jgi:hypothetical protein
MSKPDPKQLRIDYSQTFESPGGKRVLKDILAYCHILEPLTGSIDTNSIIMREARRDVALTILQKLNWKEDDFVNFTGGGE